MCIICLKPAGVDLPSDDEIKYMFERNHDGAGFAIQGDLDGDGGFKVRYKKGFMNVDDLLEALGPREKLKDLNVAIHCRIKTHGEVDKGTTHPFKLSNQYSDLRELEGSGAVLFHNGVISGLGGLINEKSSDTQDYVVGVAMRYMANPRMPGAISKKIVEQITGSSRILILYPKKNFPMIKIGTWYEHKGCFYSNMGYKSETSTTKWSGYGDYDYERPSSYYHHSSTGANKWKELDEWGCNVGKCAWPSSTEDWIRFDDDRWKLVMGQAKDVKEIAGEKTCIFGISDTRRWVIDEDNKQIYTYARAEDVALRQDEEDYIYGMGYDVNDGYIMFDDEEEMLEWLEMAKRVSDYVYKFGNELWYIDTVSLEAYTEKGIKKLFGVGQQGHVRKWLERDGTLAGHYGYERRGYGYPTDDDPDDATPLLASGYSREHEDEDDEEYQQALKEALEEESYTGA